MKNLIYLVTVLFVVVSCDTARIVYDDVYDAADFKEVSDEGYSDLIKNNEDDHKVVVDQAEPTGFGGYYSSNSGTSGGTSFTDDDCNCFCNLNRHTSWHYTQPSWLFSNNYLFDNYCSCHHHDYYWMNQAFFYGSFNNYYGNFNNYYGYYDYWGGWHPYNSWFYGSDYLAFYYGYGNGYYGWYNQGNNFNNGGSWFNGNGGSDSYAGNHFYGHRNATATGSSNTTVYEHTVRGAATNPTSGEVIATGQTVAVFDNQFGTPSGRPADGISESSSDNVATGTTNNQTARPVNTAGSGTTGTTTTGATTSTSTTTHVVATNHFEVKYPTTGTASKTGSGQSTTTTNTTYTPNPVSSGTYTNKYNSGSTNSGNETSTNSTSTSRNSGSTTTTTTTYPSSYNSGGTSSGHRNTTSTTSGSSGSTTSGSRGTGGTTTTSRR